MSFESFCKDHVFNVRISLESFVNQHAISLTLDSASRRTKISTLALAALPSVALAHNHLPCASIVPGCAFCAKHGNIYVDDGQEQQQPQQRQ